MRMMILAGPQRTLAVGVLVLCVLGYAVDPSRAAPEQVAGENELWYLSGTRAWQKQPAPGEGRIESLASDPHSQGRVLLCRGGKLWMSEDGGQSWYSPSVEPFQEQCVAVAIHPAAPTTLFMATNRHLLMSTDGGRNWETPTPGLEFKWRPLTVLAPSKAPTRLYVMTRGEGVHRSDDGGSTWAAVNSGLPKAIGAAPVAPVESAVVDPTDPDVVYVAVEANGIYKTTNGGGSWTRTSDGLPGMIMHRTHPWVLAIDPSQPKRLLVWAHWPVHSHRVDSAFFLSEDGAASWRKIAPGPDRGRVVAVQFVNGQAIAFTEQDVIVLSN